MPSNTTTSTPLPQVQPYIDDYLKRQMEVTNSPYVQSPSTFVGPNDTLTAGWNAITNRAINGNPAMGAAQTGLQDFYKSTQPGATANPYGPVNAGTNSATVSGGTNAFAAMNNPYLNKAIDAAQGDVIRNWNNVQKPAWDTQMAGSGSFGNAGVMQANGLAAGDMQRNLGRISTDMRMDAYKTSAALTESGLNRGLDANKFNVGTTDRNLDRTLNTDQFNSAQGERFATRSDNVTASNTDRMLNAYSMAPTFAANDYMDANALLKVGNDIQGYAQGDANQAKEWWKESQTYPQTRLDNYGRAIGVATGTNTTTNTPEPSPWNSIAGGALTGAQIAKLLYDAYGTSAGPMPPVSP